MLQFIWIISNLPSFTSIMDVIGIYFSISEYNFKVFRFDDDDDDEVGFDDFQLWVWKVLLFESEL